MRKTHGKEFKFKVAIEAIRGDLTVAEIISKYQVASSLIHKWKKELLDSGASIFEAEKSKKTIPGISDNELQKLHAKIGQLTLEKDFLQGALAKVR